MANTYTTVAELKQHLNIEAEFILDDNYLLELISVSEMAVSDYLNGGLSGSTTTFIVDNVEVVALPKTIKHACMLMAAHLYSNRTLVSFAQAYELPYTFKFLLNPYRNFQIN